MDATASREPTWDQACQVQGQMFLETAALGGLDVQLVYYRGFNECKASRWVDNPSDLVRLMTGVFVARVPFGRSNYGAVLTASTNGQIGVGISLMNMSLLPVLP